MKKRLVGTVMAAFLLALFPQPSQANDLAIWDKLQGTNPKGYVLMLRHAYAPGVGDPANFQLGDCSTQRNLSEEGRQDAREIGDWLERRDIPIHRIESSRWCRAKETADLLNLGKVKLNPKLDSLFQESDIDNHPKTLRARQQIINHRKKSGLLIMVGHFVNIGALTGIGVGSGEGVLVRASKKGSIKVVGATPALGR